MGSGFIDPLPVAFRRGVLAPKIASLCFATARHRGLHCHCEGRAAACGNLVRMAKREASSKASLLAKAVQCSPDPLLESIRKPLADDIGETRSEPAEILPLRLAKRRRGGGQLIQRLIHQRESQ